jgi:hypothetical protein
MPAFVNTSPIILLAKVGRLGLLRTLYGDVVVPFAVATELRAKGEASFHETESFLQSVQVQSLANSMLSRALSADLGAGEAEVIALAADVPGALVVMDGAEGRRVARGLGLYVTGTVGVLTEAKARGHIPAIAPLLDQLVSHGLWLSERMRRIILDAASERVDEG